MKCPHCGRGIATEDEPLDLVVHARYGYWAAVRRSGDQFVVRVEDQFCGGWLGHNHCPPDVPTNYSRRGIINQESAAVRFDTILEAQKAAEYFVTRPAPEPA